MSYVYYTSYCAEQETHSILSTDITSADATDDCDLFWRQRRFYNTMLVVNKGKFMIPWYSSHDHHF